MVKLTLDGKLIQALPVCAEGKEAVKQLLKGMGYQIENARPLMPGYVFKDGTTNAYALVLTSEDNGAKSITIDPLDSNPNINTYAKTHIDTTVADSLEEFYERKAKGTLRL